MKRMITFVCIVFLLVMNSFAVDVPAPKSFYDFEGEGITVTDSGEAANHGEIFGDWVDRVNEGIVTTAGDAGKAIEFVEENAFGALSCVIIPFQDFMNSGNYTISTWMKYTADANWGYLFWADGYEYAPQVMDRHIDVWLHPYDTGLGLDCILNCVDETELRVANDVAETGISLSDSNWHQIAVTLKDNQFLAIYIDGMFVVDDAGTATDFVVENDGDDLFLGARPNDLDLETSVKLIGLMDRVRFWDVALTDEQIEALYLSEGPNGGIPAGVADNTAPTNFALAQNYPNPFNPVTTISYTLNENSNVKLQIFDTVGREVASLVNEVQSAGFYETQFDASNLASGIYFYQLTANQSVESRKMMLVK